MKKNRIFYIIFLCISTGLMIGYHSKLTSVLFVFSLIIPFVSFFLGLISFVCLKAELRYKTDEIQRCDSPDIIIKIKNRFLLPINPIEVYGTFPLKTSFSFKPQCLVVGLLPFSGITIRFNSPIKYRGVYKIGLEKIQMYDILCLFRYTKKIRAIKEFTVLPKKHIILPIEDNCDNDSDITSANTFALEKNSFGGVREYTQSDSIKYIHWTMSAKQDKMMVKYFERSIGGSCIIIADLNEYFPFDEQNHEYCDCIIETMLAINLSVLSNMLTCTNLWYSPNDSKCEQLTISSLDEFSMFYDIMSKLPRQSEVYLPENIAESFVRGNDNSGIIYFITSQIRQDFVERIESIDLFRNKKIRILLLNSVMESENQIELSKILSDSKETELWYIDKDEIAGSVNTYIELNRQ